jgi:hypothetical protein
MLGGYHFFLKHELIFENALNVHNFITLKCMFNFFFNCSSKSTLVSINETLGLNRINNQPYNHLANFCSQINIFKLIENDISLNL